uniref:Branchpoint-bridging protein n=1 Tax=Labrus bergylta TaxID=56723 RepID=A0A3Q3G5G7_9LABR
MATGANATPLGKLHPSIGAKRGFDAGPGAGNGLMPTPGPPASFPALQVFQPPMPTAAFPQFFGSKKQRKKSRWSSETPDQKTVIPGMPTVIPPGLTRDQERAYIQLQIEDLTRKLRTGDLGIPVNPEDSPSPEPIYNSEGKRLNTREYRTRKKIEEERHSLITEMVGLNPDFKPPADYPPATRVNDKVMIPQDEYPEINFVGLLIGPGNTLKNIEKECCAKIMIRGKGSVKEGKVGRKDGQMLPGEDEPLHALVTANTMENVKKAVEQIRNILKQGIETPEDQNDLRKMQLRELARLNGTLREDDNILRPWQNAEPRSITNTTLCTKCGGAGHISSDCKYTSFAAHRATGGEPPQSAQDKARMDKEYLSLMAELGEAPVPSSGGGHSGNQGGAPRSSGPNSNQPPPNRPPLDELRAHEQELPQHAWWTGRSRRTSQLPSPHAQHGRPPNASKPQRPASPLDAAPSSSHGPGTRTSWTPHAAAASDGHDASSPSSPPATSRLPLLLDPCHHGNSRLHPHLQPAVWQLVHRCHGNRPPPRPALEPAPCPPGSSPSRLQPPELSPLHPWEPPPWCRLPLASSPHCPPGAPPPPPPPPPGSTGMMYAPPPPPPPMDPSNFVTMMGMGVPGMPPFGMPPAPPPPPPQN